MPELPEVEIIRQSLKKTINFDKILKVKVHNKNLRFKLSKNFENTLKNKKITNISRYAKYLIIELNNVEYLIFHFGMSGTLHLIKNSNIKSTNLSFYSSQNLPNKHNHVELIFKNFKIIYNDPRRFGYIKLIKSKSELGSFVSKMGLEPLDSKFDILYLKKKLFNRNKNIKNILLDQKIISGIGNIYASEILFHSGLNPLKKGKKIKINELKLLVKFSKRVLQNAISKGGSSIRDFKNTDGSSGLFQNEFKVYNKENFICPNYKCKFKIIKINISNRSSFYCLNCQKK